MSPLPKAVASVDDITCGCHAGKIAIVHAYLTAQFPGYDVRHFHAPTRLAHAGLPTPHADHHVIGLTRADVLPYYAVLLGEFLERAVDDITGCVRQWNVSGAVRAHRIAIVSKDGVSSL